MTSTEPATRAAAAAGAPEAAGGTRSLLGQNDFLKLMIAQLQAQNPLEPGNTNEFLSELAQLTQVEQMTNLANAGSLSSAVGLIGRTVTFNSSSGEVRTGKVESAQSTANGVTVTVEGATGVSLTSITDVE